MSSIAPSAGSTTVMGLEDDANNFSMVQTGHDVYVEDRYNTPKRASSLPVCGSTYEPECDDSLQPSIGMRIAGRQVWHSIECMLTRLASLCAFGHNIKERVV